MAVVATVVGGVMGIGIAAAHAAAIVGGAVHVLLVVSQPSSGRHTCVVSQVSPSPTRMPSSIGKSIGALVA